MKKRSLLSLLILLAPLFMANSPSPEIHPADYTSYELTDESLVISQQESNKYITISGVIENTGERIISFMTSQIIYSFDDDNFSSIYVYFENDKPIRALLPDQSYNFEKVYLYDGNAPIGPVEYSSRDVRMYAYLEEDVIQTVEISNQVVKDQTTPNMIQRISEIFERKPLISKEI